MARIPDHASCNCDSVCPLYTDCSVAWVYSPPQCVYHCEGGELPAPPEKLTESAEVEKVALDGRIDLDMRGASLGNVGALLAGIADAQIFVPADRIDERQTRYLSDVSLEAAVRELELMAVVRP